MAHDRSRKPMSQDEYVQNKGVKCPFCGDYDVQGGPVEVDAGSATQEMDCLTCEKTWKDVYKLTGYRTES